MGVRGLLSLHEHHLSPQHFFALHFSAKDFQFPMPSFVLVKRNDPVEHLTGSEDFNKINEFIEENSLSLYVRTPSFLFCIVF